MTRDEKYKAILSKLNTEAQRTFDPFHVSVMILMGYLRVLQKYGMCDKGPFDVTSSGETAIAFCEEFDWKPLDEEIETFCKRVTDPSEVPMFVFLLKEMRDNREEFLESMKNFQR